jgi:hypothetical protein
VICKLTDHGLELAKNMQVPLASRPLCSPLCASLRTLCLSFRFLQSGGAGCTPATLVARLKAQHVPGWNLQVQGAHQVRCMSEASV